jgi:hypothetical protein
MSFLSLAHFGLAPQEKRNDQAEYDAGRVTGDPGAEGTDESADVHDADGVNAGNGFAYGAPTIVPGDIHSK